MVSTLCWLLIPSHQWAWTLLAPPHPMMSLLRSTSKTSHPTSPCLNGTPFGVLALKQALSMTNFIGIKICALFATLVQICVHLLTVSHGRYFHAKKVRLARRKYYNKWRSTEPCNKWVCSFLHLMKRRTHMNYKENSHDIQPLVDWYCLFLIPFRYL